MKMIVSLYLKGCNMKNKILKLIFILTILLICIDQISKIIIKYNYEENIEDKIFSITLIENAGMAFGVNENNTKNIVLVTLILLLVMNFVRTQIEKIDTKMAVALSLILAGGISNLLDRIIHGGVIDFIKFKGFAIFNIADCYIVLGWILMVIFIWKINKEIVGGKKCEKQ